MIVTRNQNLNCFWLPSAIAANAFTIDPDEQIRRKVLNAVTGTLSTAPGLAHSPGAPKRRMTYEPISAVKNITSEARKTHIPSLRLWASTPRSAGHGGRISFTLGETAWLMTGLPSARPAPDHRAACGPAASSPPRPGESCTR